MRAFQRSSNHLIVLSAKGEEFNISALLTNYSGKPLDM